MKVLLTGSTGFVGSYTAAALVARGHRLRLLVRDPARAAAVLARRGVDVDGCEVVVGDMVDRSGVDAAVAGAEATIHTAASIGVTGRGDDQQVFTTNTAGARNVLDAAVSGGHARIVHVSSVAVFVPPGDPVITPASPLGSPRSAYARSKVHAERHARSLQARGAPVSVVYPGGVLGPDQPSLDATLEGIVGARSGGWPRTRGGVCLVDVRDVAGSLVAAVEAEGGPRRLMLGGTFFTWDELGALLDELCGVRARRVPLPRPVIVTASTLLDLLRRVRPVTYPLTRDAAEMMTTMVPTDDEATLAELGLVRRPIRGTLEDALRWAVDAGHLDVRHAPALVGHGPAADA